MTVRSRPSPFQLSPEHEALYHSVVPKEVDRAAAVTIRDYRVKDQENDLKQEGTIALALNIPKFNESYETPFPRWAFYSALHAMLQIVRVESRYRRQVAAMRLAATLHCAFETGSFDPMQDTEEEARAKLTEYTQGLAMSTLVQLAAMPTTNGGEDDAVLRETQRRVVEVMRELVADLSPEQRELLVRAYAHDMPNVKEAATQIGEKGYRAVLRAYHKLLGMLGARFAREGFTELPAWPDEASGTILGAVTEAPSYT